MKDFLGKKCVIYARVSSRWQMLNWNWLESQITICKDWAMKRGVKVLEVFKDWWISWKLSSREWLDSMIEYLVVKNRYENQVDFVLADDIDRISRDVVWWNEIKMKIIIKWKADIQTVKQELDNSIEWNLSQNIIMAVKQFERENNTRRSMDRKRWRMLDWYRVFPAPLWYEFTWRWASKILVPNDIWRILSEAFNIYADWWFMSDRDFCLYVNDKVPKIPIRTAEKVLLEDRLLLYAGFINYPNYWVNMVVAKHEPLMSAETLEKIRERKNRKTFYRKVDKDDIYDKMLLRNYLCCPKCWRPYSWWPSYNKIWNVYYYYRCTHLDCMNNKSLNVDRVHEAFWNYLKTLEIKDSIIKCFKIAIKEFYDQEMQNKNKIKQEDERLLKDYNAQIEKFLNLIVNTDDASLIGVYQWKLNEINKKKSILERKMDSLICELQDKSIEDLLDTVLPIIKSPYKLRNTGDSKLMQLVPSVVIWCHFFYTKGLDFTTHQESSLQKLFLDLNLTNCRNPVRVGFEPTVRFRTTR